MRTVLVLLAILLFVPHVPADASEPAFLVGSSFAQLGTATGYFPQPVACFENPSSIAKVIHVVYAFARDDDNQYEASKPLVRELVERANGGLVAGTDGRLRLRVECDGGVVEVHRVKINVDLADIDFAAVKSAVEDYGWGEPQDKVFVFFDDPYPCACSATWQVFDDDRLVSWNYNNGGQYSQMTVMWGRYDEVVALEALLHIMGAIQPSAPHDDGAWRCTDGRDVLCPASTSGGCPEPVIDCGRDDYLGLNPAPGTYLATNWNIAHPMNEYLRGCIDVEGSYGGPPLLDLLAAPPVVEIPVPTDCGGHMFYLEFFESWRLLPPGLLSDPLPGAAHACWMQSGQSLSCFELDHFKTDGTIPPGSDLLRIESELRSGGHYLLRGN